MVRSNVDDICLKFCKNEIIHKNTTNINRICIFYIVKVFQIFVLYFILFKESACLIIEVSFSNETKKFDVNSNKVVEDYDNIHETCSLDKISMKMMQPNIQDFSTVTESPKIFQVRNNLIDSTVTNPTDIGISNKKRKQDLFLSESDEIKSPRYDSSSQCQTNEGSIYCTEEIQPLDLRTNKKQKTFDSIELENEEQIIKPNTSIIFDYSKEFLIQSNYFNRYIFSEFNRIKFNITDLTKYNVEIATFEIFILILRFGYHKKCLDLKLDGLITILNLFYDLLCFSESNSIRNLYKNLIQCLTIHKDDISENIHTDAPENILLIEKSLFLPFLNGIFDKLDVKFDINTMDLSFLKRESQNEFYLFEKKNIDEICIRTTPEVITLLGTKPNYYLIIFYWLMSLFKISGIKISPDNKYYSECKDQEKACKYEDIAQEIPTLGLKLCYSHALESIIPPYNNEIKFLELERVNISKGFLCFIKKIDKIESLFLYKCKMPLYCKFLWQLPVYFTRLRILKINYHNLSEAFFKSLVNSKLESLDFSWSTFDGKNLKGLKLCDGIDTLNDLKLDNASLGCKVINLLLKSNSLKSLSLRNVNFLSLNRTKNFLLFQREFYFLDLSGCLFNQYLIDFYSSSFKVTSLVLQCLYLENLQNILEMNSLQIFTKILDLSKCYFNSNAIECLRKFKILETLKLCNLPQAEIMCLDKEYDFKNSLISIDISDSKFLQKIWYSYIDSNL